MTVAGRTSAGLGWPLCRDDLHYRGWLYPALPHYLHQLPQHGSNNGLARRRDCTKVRAGNSLFSHALFGVNLGLFMRNGLWLRSALRVPSHTEVIAPPSRMRGFIGDAGHQTLDRT